MHFQIIIIILIVLLTNGHNSVKLKDQKFDYEFNIKYSTDIARSMLTNKAINIILNKNVLAVMILYTYGLNKHNSKQIHCTLKLLNENLGYKTPLHTYLWLGNYKYGDTLPYWLEQMNNVFVMEIDSNSWKVPGYLGSIHNWAKYESTHLNYYLMGRWRLTFQPMFVMHMNYQYFVQMDSDNYILSKPKFNFIELFNKHNVLFSTTNLWYAQDGVSVLNGLAELTSYWLHTREYIPVGDIFNHTQPPNIYGLLTTPDSETINGNLIRGWDRQIHRGNFMIFNLNHFWFLDVVQDYLFLVLRTCSDIEQRWQEQGVVNMMILLFIPEQNKFIFNENQFSTEHGNHKFNQNFFQWNCSDFSYLNAVASKGVIKDFNDYY